MKKLYTFLTLLCSVLLHFNSNANVPSSSYIYYTQTGPNQYEVKLIATASSTFANMPSSFDLMVAIPGVNSVIEKADTSYFNYMGNHCSAKGSDTLQSSTYVYHIDFDSTKYNWADNECGIYFMINTCCIGGGNKTVFNGNLFNYAFVDKCVGNNAPPDGSDNFRKLRFDQLNVGTYKTFFSVDPDGDRLEYTIDTARDAANQLTSYRSGFDPKNFNIFYYPPNLPPNRKDDEPNANPPWGVTLNRENGNFIYTPIYAGEYYFNVLIKEYRIVNGVEKVVGITRRNVTLETGNNTSPLSFSATKPFINDICAGDSFSMNVSANYQTSNNDSAFIEMLHADRWVSANYNRSSSNVHALTFGFQTDVKDLDTLNKKTYFFHVKGNNNACPINHIQERVITVNVHRKIEANTTITPIGCGRYKIESNPTNYDPLWVAVDHALLDLSHQPLNTNIGSFLGSQSHNSFVYNDSFQFAQEGKYVIYTSMRTPDNPCIYEHYDTVDVKTGYKLDINFTDGDVGCKGNKLDIKANITGPQTGNIFFWPGRTGVSFADTARLNIKENKHQVWATAANANGCVASTEFTYYGQDVLNFDLGNDTLFCGQLKITPKINNENPDRPNTYKWSNNQNTKDVWVNDSAKLNLTVSNSCNIFTDNISVYKQKEYPATFDTMQICEGEEMVLRFDPDPNSSIEWSGNGVSSLADSVTISKEGNYYLKLANKCGLFSKNYHLDHIVEPDFNLGPDTIYCGDFSHTLTARDTGIYNWSTSENTKEITVTEEGVYSLTIQNICFSATDQIQIIREDEPNINFGQTVFDVTVPIDTVFQIPNQGPSSIYWWGPDDSTRSLRITESGKYTAWAKNSCGITNTTIEVRAISSILPLAVSGIKIYPNPISDQFTIALKAENEKAKVAIYNSVGQKMRNIELTGKQTQIETTEWSAGVYILHVDVNGNSYFTRLIKQ